MSMKVNVVSFGGDSTVLLGDASIGCLYGAVDYPNVFIVPFATRAILSKPTVPVLHVSKDGKVWGVMEMKLDTKLFNVSERLDISISGNYSFVGFDASKVFIKQAFISSCDIEKLQEENKRLKGAIANIYRYCQECVIDGSGTYYAVEQDYVNEAYELLNVEK